MDLFAGIAVRDLARAVDWFDRFFGEFFGEVETFAPNDVERVWTIGEHRHVYVVVQPAAAGHSLLTLFVDDLDALLRDAASRGITPDLQETYGNGVRKAVFHDPDGNEIGVGGGPG